MLSLEIMKEASDYVTNSGLCRRTPTLKNVQLFFDDERLKTTKLCLKLENMQNSGCFKMRGVTHQLHKIQPSLKPGQKLVTFSGGNYGKAFSMVTGIMKIPSRVIMAKTVPSNRIGVIKSFGSEVELVDSTELVSTIQKRQSEGMLYLDPFDDYNLIAAYGAVGFEILEDVPDTDIVLVPCGGGGLLSGTAAGIKAMGGDKYVEIYGVEPETANTMHESYQIGHPAKLPGARSVASGLCPPYAGEITYKVCKENVDDILLVNDEEIKNAVKALHKLGFIIEPSGAAGLAAVLSGKIPGDIKNKTITVVISGGNITLDNLKEIVDVEN